jgi:hypothetical protein
LAEREFPVVLVPGAARADFNGARLGYFPIGGEQTREGKFSPFIQAGSISVRDCPFVCALMCELHGAPLAARAVTNRCDCACFHKEKLLIQQ